MSWRAVLAVGVLAVGVGSCKISELWCRNSRCLPLDLYCNGVDDCGDGSDEPKYCTVCNRTYYGEVGRTYSLSPAKPRDDRLPFLCHLTFTANGQDYGDIVQLLLERFSVGRWRTEEGEGADGKGECPDGILQVTELGRPLSEGGWCGSSAGPAALYSESSTLTLTLRLVHSAPFHLSLGYKMLRGREVAAREGGPGGWERGSGAPGTACSRAFEDCHRRPCALLSPNYPGLYPRNLTCLYSLRQRAVPTCKHAMLRLSQVHLRLHRSGSGIASGAENASSGECGPGDDGLVFYDGPTEDSPVLGRWCGGGPLPAGGVVSRGPVLLVAFRSTAYARPAPEPNLPNLHGFLLRADAVFADSDSLDYSRNDRCEFLVNGSLSGAKRRGTVRSPRHSLPPNTTCSYRLVGLPADRVWLQFDSYSAPRPAGRGRTRTRGGAAPDCGTRLRVWEESRVLAETCDAPPRLCDHASLRNATRGTRPCTVPGESYLTRDSSLHVEVTTREGSVAAPFSFKFRYEFVDTRLGGEARPGAGAACSRLFRRGRSGAVVSPRNVFMFGRGGAESLSCTYRIEGGAGERVRLSIHNASFGRTGDGGGGCRTAADRHTSRPVCAEAGRSVKVLVWDSPWSDVVLERACYCDSSVLGRSSSSPAVFLSSSRVLELGLRVSGFLPDEDFEDVYLSATWERVKWAECARHQRLAGSGGEIALEFPPARREDLYCEGRPWLVEARPAKSLFLLTWGRFLPSESSSDDCHTTNRVLLYTGSPLRLSRVVCPSKGKEKELAVHVFSEEWFGGGVGAEGERPSFLVEWLAKEPGTATLSWLEISKSRSFSARRHQSPSAADAERECHHRCPELNACISPGLYCDGRADCPSGHDERGPDCGTGLGAAGPALLASLVVLTCLGLVGLCLGLCRPRPPPAPLIDSESSTAS